MGCPSFRPFIQASTCLAAIRTRDFTASWAKLCSTLDTKELEREKLWRERDREIDESGRLETLRHREVLSQAARGGKWDRFHINHIITASPRVDKVHQKVVQRERKEDQRPSWVPNFRYSSKDRDSDRGSGLPENQTQNNQLVRMIGL